jgi:O-antigen chain-terminating methyltransferase
MKDNTIEIRDDEINVEEIMAKIRENIRRRQAAGELPPDPDSVIGSHSKNYPAGESDDAIQRDLSYINSNWDIHNNSYFISSHHPYLGRFLIKGRQMVHGEVRRYLDPIVHKQTVFNQSTERVLNCLAQSEEELDGKISEAVKERDAFISKINTKHENTTHELENKIHELENSTHELENKIYEDVQNAVLAINTDIEKKAWLAQVLNERVQKGLVQKRAPPASTSKENINYFLFEERFRGSREEIKKRQLAFLSYFEKCSLVLDIGSGRGEFLEILKDHDIGGIGVDSDPDMVAYCRSRQLEVEHSDAIAYLETLEDNSLDGIFIDQVVEHLEPEYLIRLLALCHQKMKFGYHIVIETVNPLSFVSFVNFYIDMTHKRPVHPETLQYLLSAAGFRECEKKFFSPVSDEGRLKQIEGTADMNETESKNVDVYNHNVEMLNTVLFGAQDYAVVGKK